MIFTVVSSNFHLELNPRWVVFFSKFDASFWPFLYSDLGMYDRVIVQDVIKSIAQTQQIDANAKHHFKGLFFSNIK